MDMRDGDKQLLIEKFSVDYMLSILDRSKISFMERIYKPHTTGLDVIDFVRLMLNTIEHHE
jgi:hypothetical protein